MCDKQKTLHAECRKTFFSPETAYIKHIKHVSFLQLYRSFPDTDPQDHALHGIMSFSLAPIQLLLILVLCTVWFHLGLFWKE